MINADEVLAAVEQFGPVIPSDLTSRFKKDTMILGAVLSQLVAQKKIKITYAKWDGSPLYYVPSQIEGIQKVSEKMNSKDREAFELLREKHVLRDDLLTPLERTSLRVLKDFAIPITVKMPQGSVLFWKWYLTSNQEASDIIRSQYVQEDKPAEVVTKEPADVETPKHENEDSEKPVPLSEVEEKKPSVTQSPVSQQAMR